MKFCYTVYKYMHSLFGTESSVVVVNFKELHSSSALLWYNGTLPNLKHFTLWFWIKFGNYIHDITVTKNFKQNHKQHIISYVVADDPQHLYVGKLSLWFK